MLLIERVNKYNTIYIQTLQEVIANLNANYSTVQSSFMAPNEDA